MAPNKTILLDFLKSQPMAVITTVDPATMQPEASLIAFAETDELELIFATFAHTRKWRNLQQNPHVALVIGQGTRQFRTMQYEGNARPVLPRDTELYIKLLLAKDTPCTERFLRDPRVRLYKIKPAWIRCADYTSKLPAIIEETFGKTRP